MTVRKSGIAENSGFATDAQSITDYYSPVPQHMPTSAIETTVSDNRAFPSLPSNARAIFVGPMPPAVGGIASILLNLQICFKGNPRIRFVDSAKSSCGLIGRLKFSLQILKKLIRACAEQRSGWAIFFCSAGTSFWEKTTWAIFTRLFGVRPILVMVDGGFPRFFESLSPIRKTVARLLMKNVDRLAVQSGSWDAYYRSIFPKVKNTIVAGGVDTEFFVPSGDSTRDSVPVVLYVGWMIAAKGIDDLLQAALLLNERSLQFKVRMVGPAFGRDREIQQAIKDLALEDCVTYEGCITDRIALRREYWQADIFTLPSHFEGFPVALMEASACGLACVATNVGGCPEILEYGSAGLLVNPHSPAELAHALESLIQDSAVRQTIGFAARQRSARHYSMDRCLDSYRNLIGFPDTRFTQVEASK